MPRTRFRLDVTRPGLGLPIISRVVDLYDRADAGDSTAAELDRLAEQISVEQDGCPGPRLRWAPVSDRNQARPRLGGYRRGHAGAPGARTDRR